MTKLRELHKDLVDWANSAKEELGYFQEFDLKWDIKSDKHGYIYDVELREAEEQHVLAGARGRTPDKAIEQLYAGRLSQGLRSWGWPSEFPVK